MNALQEPKCSQIPTLAHKLPQVQNRKKQKTKQNKSREKQKTKQKQTTTSKQKQTCAHVNVGYDAHTQ